MTMTHRVLLGTGILIILGGIMFVTLLMVDKAKPEVSFSFSEYSLIDSNEHEVKPLEKQQIQEMVKRLIPRNLESGNGRRKIALSSPNKKIMKDFQEYLQKELPEGWIVNRSTSHADALITYRLFKLRPPEKIQNTTSSDSSSGWAGVRVGGPRRGETTSPGTRKAELVGTEKGGNELFPIPTQNFEENRSELLPINQNSNGKPINQDEASRRALFLYWIVETIPDSKIGFGATTPDSKIVLGAAANYKNPNVSAASKDIVNNLIEKNLIDTEKSLKIAVINIIYSEETRIYLVTASILEEMVNAKTDLTFLDIRYTSKHATQLKQVLQSNNNQKVSLEDAAEKFSNSTGASAVLIISQPSEGHFYLELMELPELNILAIGRSDNHSEE